MSNAAWNDVDHPRDRAGRFTKTTDAPEINDRLALPAETRADDPWADAVRATVSTATIAPANTPGHVDCRDCDGSGEVWTGHVEPDTGAYLTRTCNRCDGRGELTVEDDAAWQQDYDDFNEAETRARTNLSPDWDTRTAAERARDSWGTDPWDNGVTDEPPF